VSLAKEWIAGRLAQRFGLPIPQFSILSVPRELIEGSVNANLSELGHGLVFGSRAVENVDEISITNVQNMSRDIMRDIVAFDWFVMNGDRTLSADGGNPNILWSLSENQPYVIDHNLAFDESVTLNSLEASHIFGFMVREVADTSRLQREYEARFAASLTGWEEICLSLPERWNYIDDRQTLSTNFSVDHARTIVGRFEKNDLWIRR
jgi:hypothetical protein